MNVSIQFQSLDRIEGKEGRSKLLHTESKLYQILKQIKQGIEEQHQIGADRMDLHIEISKLRRDSDFRTKAESLDGQVLDLSNASNWRYMGRAFVLNTPEVEDYGETHATVAFFGRHPKPSLQALLDIVALVLEESDDW